MESVLAFIGLASVVLLLVALGVAWWEQRHGSAHKRPPLPPPQFPLPVDVEIDAPAAPATALDDQAARRAMLGNVLARAARPAGASSAAAWLETRPTVLDKLPPERLRHSDGQPPRSDDTA